MYTKFYVPVRFAITVMLCNLTIYNMVTLHSNLLLIVCFLVSDSVQNLSKVVIKLISSMATTSVSGTSHATANNKYEEEIKW